MSDIRAELQKIYDAHKKLTAPIVVNEVETKGKAHPLWSHFEWNDKIAGPKYREIQAQHLIRSVRITYAKATPDEAEQSVRQWHAVYVDDGDGNGYKSYEPIERVACDPVLQAIVITSMARDWASMKRRYEGMRAFWELVEADVISWINCKKEEAIT